MRTHSRALLLSHTLLPGYFPCVAQAGTAGTDLLSHRCSFQKSLGAAHGVQLCWPSKVRLQQLLSGADTSCTPRGEVENMERRAMISTNKPRISYVCGKKFYNIAVSKNSVKKACSFGPGTEAANTQLVILIAWLVGVGGTDNVKISSAFQICFPPTVSRR